MNTVLPLPSDPNEIVRLIFSLREGQYILFLPSPPKNGVYPRIYSGVNKGVYGDEFYFDWFNEDNEKIRLESDEDVKAKVVEEVVGYKKFYEIGNDPNYVSGRIDRDEDPTGQDTDIDFPPDRPTPQFENKSVVKATLLEYLVRACAKEVLKQINESKNKSLVMEDETKGAAAPPADGQGTAEQPPIPKDADSNKDVAQSPEKKQTPEPTPEPSWKGINFVSPFDKSQIIPIEVKAADDASVQRAIYDVVSKHVSPKVKLSISAVRKALAAANQPEAATFLYVGQTDPDSNEFFVMADNSLQLAKDSSAPAEIVPRGHQKYSGSKFDSTQATHGDYLTRMSSGGQTTPTGIDEQVKKLIKQLVNQALNRK